jgi:hypothetical protein
MSNDVKKAMESVQNVQEETGLIPVVDTKDTARATQELMDSFKNPSAALYSSITDDGSRETRVKIYNAINSGNDSLSDHIKEVIEVQDIVAHPIQIADENSGEIIDALRVVLVTPDGKTYASVSLGVASSLQKIIPLVGQAPWTPPLKIIPTEVKTRRGFKTLTLTLEA